MDDNNFQRSLNFTLQWEGGYSFDSKDPGGETNFGISKKSYPDIDIKKLTRDSATEIYRHDYWLASEACLSEWPLCLAVFDTAVNCGVSRADDFLECAEDVFSGDPIKTAISICDFRISYYRCLANKNFHLNKFLNGWLDRVNQLKIEIKK